MPKKRFLILTSDSGFGHRSAANSVAKALSEAHPLEVIIRIVNPVKEKQTPVYLRQTERDYDRNVLRNQRFYRFTYEISNSRSISSLVEGTLILSLYQSLRRIYLETCPDVILNTAPLFNAPMGAVLDNLHSAAPLYTVVTDLADVHTMWFNHSPDKFFVGTEAVREKALACGIREENIILSGIPVDPALGASRNTKSNLRISLGLQPDLTTLLFVGSPRVNGMINHIRVLEQASFPFQVVAIAGGNQELYADLKQHSWNFPMHVEDFVQNMHTWLECADIQVTKAGGLILSEGLAAGLPIIIIDHLPGQETGNVEFVTGNQAGVYAYSPQEFLSIVQYWGSSDRNILHQIAGNAARIGFPGSARNITDELWKATSRRNPAS